MAKKINIPTTKEELKEALRQGAEKAEAVAADVADVVTEKGDDVAKKASKAVKKATESTEKAAKKVAKKASEVLVDREVYIQYQSNEIKLEEVYAKVTQKYVEEGHKETEIKSLQLYVKPEDQSAYYVINKNNAGRIDLF